jgi:hypothetical protein
LLYTPLTCGNVLADVLPGRVSGAVRRRPAAQPPGRRFVLRCMIDTRALVRRSAAFDMGGDLVAEVAVPRRAEPGDLRADPTADRRPDLPM